MSAEESRNPVLSGVHLAQEPLPESPFSSAEMESPFSQPQYNGQAPIEREEQQTSEPYSGPRPPPVAPALKTSASAGAGDAALGIGSPRFVSWNDANLSMVREYEVSETQESQDWDGCKCCCLQ